MSPSNRRKTGLERVLRPHIVETLAAPPFATRAVFCEGRRALQEAPGDLRRARSTLRSPTVTMSTCTLTWDEDEGGDRDPDNLASSPMQETFYKSTKEAIDWRPSGDHSTGRVVVPSVFLENLFAPALVVEPDAMKDYKPVTRCLDVPWIEKAIGRLMEEGLCEDEEGKIIVYKSYDELVRAAHKLVVELKDDEALQIKAEAFEWLEDYPRQDARSTQEQETPTG